MSGREQMNIEEVTRFYQLASRVTEAIEAADDPAVKLIWLKVQASDLWTATAGGDPFCELLMTETIYTLEFQGWNLARRVKRIRDFAVLGGFLPIGESR